MNLNTAVDLQLSAIESNLVTDLEILARIICSHGYNCRAFSPKSLVTLRMLTVEKKKLLSKQIKNILNIVSYASEAEISEENHPEGRFISQALKMYDLEVQDSFWKTLKKNDVVEVYSSENIQLFRTFNFFAISSYSLLDLLTNEWFHLWERPSFVMDSIVQQVTEILTGKIQDTTQGRFARHIVKEIYHDESVDFKCSSVLVEPGVFSPLYAKDSKEVKGFLFTLRGQVVGYDNDSNKISVI